MTKYSRISSYTRISSYLRISSYSRIPHIERETLPYTYTRLCTDSFQFLYQRIWFVLLTFSPFTFPHPSPGPRWLKSGS